MYNGVKGYLKLEREEKGFDVQYYIDPTTTIPKTYLTVEMNENFNGIWKLLNEGDKATMIANGMNEHYELELTSKPCCLKYTNKEYAQIHFKILNIASC